MPAKKKTAVTLLLCVLFLSQTAYAEDPGNNIPVQVYETNTDSNIKILSTYSEGVAAEPLDIYRITYKDVDSGDYAHIDVDASTGITVGYLNPGSFRVTGINYLGSNPALKDQPASTYAFFSAYEMDQTEIPLCIGAQAVQGMRESEPNRGLFENWDADSGIDTDLTDSVIQINQEETNYQWPFMDESVFGDNEEARQQYLDYLNKEGYMDDDGNWTEKALEIFEECKGYAEEENASQAAGDGEESTSFEDASSGEALHDTGASAENENSGSQDVKEVRFDENQQEAEVSNAPTSSKASLLNRILAEILPLSVFLLVVIGVVFYLRRIKKR